MFSRQSSLENQDLLFFCFLNRKPFSEPKHVLRVDGRDVEREKIISNIIRQIAIRFIDTAQIVKVPALAEGICHVRIFAIQGVLTR